MKPFNTAVGSEFHFRPLQVFMASMDLGNMMFLERVGGHNFESEMVFFRTHEALQHCCWVRVSF